MLQTIFTIIAALMLLSGWVWLFSMLFKYGDVSPKDLDVAE